MFVFIIFFFFFSSRRRHTRSLRDWSSDVCSSDLIASSPPQGAPQVDQQLLPKTPDDVQSISPPVPGRSEEHTSELQSRRDLVCRLLLEKKKKKKYRLLINKKKNIIKKKT